MKCPVCKIDLDLSDQGLDELYCDCSNCGSSLLFKGKECEILSEGLASPAEGESPPIPSKKESGQKSEEEKAIAFDQDPSSAIEPEEEGGEREMTAPSDESQEPYPSQPEGEAALSEEGDPALPEEALGELKEGEDPASPQEGDPAEEERQSVPEESAPEEEEFVPEEGTAVPELNAPEEATEEPEAETAEKEEPEDFQFEEEAQDPSSEESPDEEKAQAKSPENPPGDSKKEDFSEVAEFGASQDQDKQGPYIYDLTLSEINSQDLREKALSVLEDERLGLDFGEKGPAIKEGQITVQKISPVQAYIIAVSLMGLPLDISWEQRHIADSPQ